VSWSVSLKACEKWQLSQVPHCWHGEQQISRGKKLGWANTTEPIIDFYCSISAGRGGVIFFVLSSFVFLGGERVVFGGTGLCPHKASTLRLEHLVLFALVILEIGFS
jgi:hypothetical protein